MKLEFPKTTKRDSLEAGDGLTDGDGLSEVLGNGLADADGEVLDDGLADGLTEGDGLGDARFTVRESATPIVSGPGRSPPSSFKGCSLRLLSAQLLGSVNRRGVF